MLMNKYDKQKNKVRSDFLQDVINPMVERRYQLRLTQEDVNFKIGVADRLVSKWECGTRTPNAFNLICWAEVLDGKIAFIANDNKQSPSDMINQKSNDNVVENNMTWKELACPIKKVA